MTPHAAAHPTPTATCEGCACTTNAPDLLRYVRYGTYLETPPPPERLCPRWAARTAWARAWVELCRQQNRPAEQARWERLANKLDPHHRFVIPPSSP